METQSATSAVWEEEVVKLDDPLTTDGYWDSEQMQNIEDVGSVEEAMERQDVLQQQVRQDDSMRQDFGQTNRLQPQSFQPGMMAPGMRQHDSMGQGSMQKSGSQMASILGWVSLGLGAAYVATPKQWAKWIGIQGSEEQCAVIQAVGLRELAVGAGILLQPQNTGWLWARVGGDVMDLALLGAAFGSKQAKPWQIAAAMAAISGITVADVMASQQMSGKSKPMQGEMSGEMPGGMSNEQMDKGSGIYVKKSITINRSPDELYNFWRDFENLPQIMHHLEAVHVQDSIRSHWIAKAPAGLSVEWDAEMIADQPNELIGWRSLPGASVDSTGNVRFEPAPGQRGTEVTVEMQYNPPAGKLGAVVAKFFGEEPKQQLEEDLRRFKSFIETDEVPTISGQPAGRNGGKEMSI